MLKQNILITLFILLALFSSDPLVEAKKAMKRTKRRRFDADYAWSQLTAALKDDAPAPAPVAANLNCDQAIDELLLRLPEFGSIFYALVNGWYLGQWADYSSCLGDATDSQYVLATVNGDYGGPFEFSRGGFGKYTGGFATHMGLCFPKQCTMDEVEGYTKELIKGYAEGIGWKNVNISYYAASDHDALQTEKTSTGIVLLAGIMGLALIAVMVGSCIEASTFGDREEVSNAVDADALHQAAQFRRLEQYDAVLLQRKSDRARTMLPFSMLRNGVHLNLPQRSLRTAIQNEKKDTAIRKDRRIAQYLKVFNGLKGSAMLLMIWGFTFYFVSFSVISNKDQMEQM